MRTTIIALLLFVGCGGSEEKPFGYAHLFVVGDGNRWNCSGWFTGTRTCDGDNCSVTGQWSCTAGPPVVVDYYGAVWGTFGKAGAVDLSMSTTRGEAFPLRGTVAMDYTSINGTLSGWSDASTASFTALP